MTEENMVLEFAEEERDGSMRGWKTKTGAIVVTVGWIVSAMSSAILGDLVARGIELSSTVTTGFAVASALAAGLVKGGGVLMAIGAVHKLEKGLDDVSDTVALSALAVGSAVRTGEDEDEDEDEATH